MPRRCYANGYATEGAFIDIPATGMWRDCTEDKMSIQTHSSIYGHPGEWLRTEVIEAHSLGVTDAAKRLGMTDSELSTLLAGQSDLTGIPARRFEKAFGVKADTLMRMQAAYDLARAG